jgi:hypothetical protein
MKETNHYECVLRWYPPNWRARYGQGLGAPLEDTYGENPVPLRIRASLARAGTVERAREVGVIGETTSSNERLRVGSQLILCGWSLFVVAGAIFAKFTEHWNVATPAAHRTLASIGVTAVQWAGVVGAIAVLVAALFVIPAVVRLVRAQGWTSIRRPVLRNALAVGSVVALIAGLALWAHHLSFHQRNSGMLPYTVGVLFTCFVILVAIATVTSTVITITRGLDFSRRILRLLSSLALGLTLLMGVIVAGVGVWWASEATYAPHFLANSIGSGILLTSNALPPALIVAGVLMLLGLSSALAGSLRVLGGFKRT